MTWDNTGTTMCRRTSAASCEAQRSKISYLSGASGLDGAGMQHAAIPCVCIVCYLRRRTRQQACGAGGVVGVGRRGRLGRPEREWRRHEASALAIRRLRVAGHHAGRNGRGLRQPDPRSANASCAAAAVIAATPRTIASFRISPPRLASSSGHHSAARSAAHDHFRGDETRRAKPRAGAFGMTPATPS